MKPFISTDDLSALVATDLTSLPLAGIAIDSACQKVRTYLGQQLNYLADDTVSLSGSGTVQLVLPEIPVVGAVTATVDGTDVDPTTLYVTAGGVLVRSDDVWPRGVQNCVVTYSHGYAFEESDVEDDPTDDTPKPDRMPSDIREVALQLASRIFLASGVGSDTEQVASGTPAPTSLSEDERRDLGPYRTVRVA